MSSCCFWWFLRTGGFNCQPPGGLSTLQLILLPSTLLRYKKSILLFLHAKINGQTENATLRNINVPESISNGSRNPLIIKHKMVVVVCWCEIINQILFIEMRIDKTRKKYEKIINFYAKLLKRNNKYTFVEITRTCNKSKLEYLTIIMHM